MIDLVVVKANYVLDIFYSKNGMIFLLKSETVKVFAVFRSAVLHLLA